MCVRMHEHRERSMISKTFAQVGVYVCIVYQLCHKSCILVIFLIFLSLFTVFFFGECVYGTVVGVCVCVCDYNSHIYLANSCYLKQPAASHALHVHT